MKAKLLLNIEKCIFLILTFQMVLPLSRYGEKTRKCFFFFKKKQQISCQSKTLSAGNQVTTFDTKYGTFGLAICYDMRFGSLAQLMAQRGASFLVYPGAFNTTTGAFSLLVLLHSCLGSGPLHWELLIRARAVDNQLFVAAISPARDEKAGYQAWGHSTIVSPWGRILANTDHTER